MWRFVLRSILGDGLRIISIADSSAQADRSVIGELDSGARPDRYMFSLFDLSPRGMDEVDSFSPTNAGANRSAAIPVSTGFGLADQSPQRWRVHTGPCLGHRYLHPPHGLREC